MRAEWQSNKSASAEGLVGVAGDEAVEKQAGSAPIASERDLPGVESYASDQGDA
jgi:hypothetical protein